MDKTFKLLVFAIASLLLFGLQGCEILEQILVFCPGNSFT